MNLTANVGQIVKYGITRDFGSSESPKDSWLLLVLSRL